MSARKRQHGPSVTPRRGYSNHSSSANPAASEQIGEGTNKGRDSGNRQQVSNDRPDVRVAAPDIRVDEGDTAAEEIDRNLRGHPEETHGYDCHEAFYRHLHEISNTARQFKAILLPAARGHGPCHHRMSAIHFSRSSLGCPEL